MNIECFFPHIFLFFFLCMQGHTCFNTPNLAPKGYKYNFFSENQNKNVISTAEILRYQVP